MILKGNISTVDNLSHKARVILKTFDNDVTTELPVALHVGDLNVNDMVAVTFFTENMADGLIIAKF